MLWSIGELLENRRRKPILLLWSKSKSHLRLYVNMPNMIPEIVVSPQSTPSTVLI